MTHRRLDRFRLRHGWNMSPLDMQVYGFADGRDVRDAVNYLTYPTYRHVVRPALNDADAFILTEHKWVFYCLAVALRIPTPQTFGLYDPAFGITPSGEAFSTPARVMEVLREHRPPGVVIKPAGGRQGGNVLILDRLDYDSGRAVAVTGESLDLEEVLRELPVVAEQGYRGYVVQQRVEQHDFFRRINPYTPNTIRVVTLRTAGGIGESHLAIARLGRRGRAVDNWSRGGCRWQSMSPAGGSVADTSSRSSVAAGLSATLTPTSRSPD